MKQEINQKHGYLQNLENSLRIPISKEIGKQLIDCYTSEKSFDLSCTYKRIVKFEKSYKKLEKATSELLENLERLKKQTKQ